MKQTTPLRSLAAAALVLGLGLQSVTVAQNKADEKQSAWRFVVTGDSRGDAVFGTANYAPDNGVNKAVMTKLIAQINKEKPDFVLFIGDAVMGEKKQEFASGTPGSLKFEMKGWIELMKTLNCPWYFSPGNHEAYHSSNEQALRDVFTETGHEMPKNGPPDQLQLAYSFDHKGVHFVSLNSCMLGQPHHVQTDWMKNDLGAVKAERIFVMSHEPAFSIIGEGDKCLEAAPADRDAFWKIMTEKKVAAYLCAHEHVYYRNHPVPQSDVWQIIIGCAGAPQDAIPNSKEVQKPGYLLVEINGTKVSYQMKDITGKVMDKF